MIGIGSTLYRFDENRRVYRRDENGRSYGAPIYSEYFKAKPVVGETKLSWIVGSQGWDEEKVSKKQIITGCARRFYTKEAMEDAIWQNQHAIAISDAVRHAPASQLRQIATLIGYEVEP